MNKILTFALATIALFACGQVLASDVANVALSCADGTTIATININTINDNSPIRFTHQTVEAKDGKPFRVIVDILTARHRLGTNNFLSLPDCPIKGIRTSQYSYQPEAVVRIVFDMEAEQVYQVKSDANSVRLYFDDKAKRSFRSWSASAAVASKPTQPKSKASVAQVASPPAKKSATELNKSIDKDRIASLEPQKETVAPSKTTSPPKKAAVKKPVAKAPVDKTQPPAKKGSVAAQPSVWPASTPYGPYVDLSLLEETQVSPAVAASTTKPVAPKETKVASKPEAKPKAKPSPVKAQQTPIVAKAEVKPVADKTAPAQTPKATVAKTDAGSSGSARSTSRFRRSPAQSRKIKGTMVAEFPKRLVIKYKSTAFRDPFATLIDETKTYDNPVERQVPNVEGLKLVGILQAGTTDNRALFEDSEGYGYILKTGDKVQKGYVLRVESDRVYFQIFEYGWSRTVALHLES